MKFKSLIYCFLLLFPLAVSAQKQLSMRQAIKQVEQQSHVSFVYSSDLPLPATYQGRDLTGLSLKESLSALFGASSIGYKVQGQHVLLFAHTAPSKSSAPSRLIRHTLSGYVQDKSGETLINATVRDISTGAATITNAQGFFSLTLPEGTHTLRASYVGYVDEEIHLTLKSDKNITFSLRADSLLPEIAVVGDLNSPLATPQTGKYSLSARDINTSFSLLSSPDVVKTLQRMSGVNTGVELMSGMYVHGGDGDENLFMIDGTPLYQINHAVGLFSAFNTDMIKNIDFYKGGFPARYTGRLSSVIDARTSDGDFQHFHGSYRIGMLDGSLHLEGPIVKGRTSYNFGIRRTWMDLISTPILWAINARNSKEDDDVMLSYFFHDLNLKLTHIFNDRSRMSFSLYSGMDRFKGEITSEDSYNDTHYKETNENSLKWGNLNMALQYQHQISPKLFGQFALIYTHNTSNIISKDQEYNWSDRINDKDSYYMYRKYHSYIDDFGYRAHFDWRPSPQHHLRFGQDFTFHAFHPQTSRFDLHTSGSYAADTVHNRTANRLKAAEFSAYIEDDIRLNEMWSGNAGVNLSLFHVPHRTFFSADPRLSIRFQPWRKLAFKASFTGMTQYVMKISNSFIDLPTDYWVPITHRLNPKRSWQTTVGTYYRPNRRWMLSLEGYYKRSSHILQYASWNGIAPPADKWDRLVMDGSGRFYGMELDAAYTTSKLRIEGSYTLSWNERFYPDFYKEWYADKFDNRHKVNLLLHWDTGRGVSLYADWSYHSGNRITVPTQWIMQPELPQTTTAEIYTASIPVYERPYNYKMPDYHRLDIGMDFRHTTKRGHQRIWNISLYNAYCHLNSMFVSIDTDEKFKVRNHAYIPIIPSISYTIKF